MNIGQSDVTAIRNSYEDNNTQSNLLSDDDHIDAHDYPEEMGTSDVSTEEVYICGSSDEEDLQEMYDELEREEDIVNYDEYDNNNKEDSYIVGASLLTLVLSI